MTGRCERMEAIADHAAFRSLTKRELAVLWTLVRNVRDDSGRCAMPTPWISARSGVPERWVPQTMQGLEGHGLISTVRRASGRAPRCVAVAPFVDAAGPARAAAQGNAGVALTEAVTPTAIDIDELDDEREAPGVQRRGWPQDDGFDGAAASAVEESIGRPAVPGLLLLHLNRFARDGGTVDELRTLLRTVESHTNPRGMLTTLLSRATNRRSAS